MNKKIKKLITFTALTGVAMHAFNRFIDYHVSAHGITETQQGTYYNWRNGNIYYQKRGSGKALLLLHDLHPVSSSYEWSQLIGKLSKTHTVYAIDLLGCGKSDKPRCSYVNYLYVELVNDFIQHVIQEKTDLLVTGASFSFAVMAARMNEESVGKITVINPTDITKNVQPPTKYSEWLKRIIELPILGTFIYNLRMNRVSLRRIFKESYYYDFTKVSYTLPELYYETAHLQGNSGKYLYASMLGNYTNINIIHALKVIQTPIHFIISDTETDSAKEYLHYHQNLTIDYIEKAGYLPQLEKPEELLHLL